MEVSRLSTSDWLGQFDAVTINSTATEMTDPEVGSSVIQEGIGDGLGVVGVETLLGNGVGMDVAGKYTGRAVGDAYDGSCVGVGEGSREGAGSGHLAGIDGAGVGEGVVAGPLGRERVVRGGAGCGGI